MKNAIGCYPDGISISDIRKGAGNTDAELGIIAGSGSAFAHIAYLQLLYHMVMQMSIGNVKISPIGVIIPIGFLLLFLCSWRYADKIEIARPTRQS